MRPGLVGPHRRPARSRWTPGWPAASWRSLRGAWSIERQLADHRCGVRSSLTGQAGSLAADGPAPNSPVLVLGGRLANRAVCHRW
jgi:hypothetical protein